MFSSNWAFDPIDQTTGGFVVDALSDLLSFRFGKFRATNNRIEGRLVAWKVLILNEDKRTVEKAIRKRI